MFSNKLYFLKIKILKQDNTYTTDTSVSFSRKRIFICKTTKFGKTDLKRSSNNMTQRVYNIFITALARIFCNTTLVAKLLSIQQHSPTYHNRVSSIFFFILKRSVSNFFELVHIYSELCLEPINIIF